jgi:ELWxxDGT repeat protein
MEKNNRLIALFLLFTSSLIGQVNLIKDINTGSAPSNPRAIMTIGNLTYFNADDGKVGYEPWVTDGTEGGTRLLKDINKGESSSFINGACNLNNKILMFVADFASTSGSIESTQLWLSDGTTNGTVRVSDSVFQVFSNLNPFQIGQVAYFITTQGLCKTDGTALGTQIIKKGIQGGYNTNFNISGNFVATDNGIVYFQATDSQGTELWRTDGTTAGTYMVKDILTGAGSSSPRDIVAIGNKVFFTAKTTNGARELWVSDGTSANTKVVITLGGTLAFDDGAYQPMVFNNSVYFFGKKNTVSGINYYELWRTNKDGDSTTMISTQLTATLNATNSYWYAAWQNKLYFVRSTNNGQSGESLWESDGTSLGTKMVHSLPPFTGISNRPTPKFFDFVLTDTLLYIGGSISKAEATEVLVSNGKSTGLKVLKDIYRYYGFGSFPKNFAKGAGNKVYFAANDGGASGNELFTSDGTETGTKLVKNINTKSDHAGIGTLKVLSNQLIVNAFSEEFGYEMWRTDGTSTGTNKVKDIGVDKASGTQTGYPFESIELNGNLIFTANDSIRQNELWRTNGTETGTTILKDIAQGIQSSSNPSRLTSLGNKVVFTAQESTTGQELYVTDGTEAGTNVLIDLNQGASMTSFSQNFATIGDSLYFLAYAPRRNEPRLLWKTNGTEVGTKPIDGSERLGTLVSNSFLHRLGNQILFTAYPLDSSNIALFNYDGTRVQQIAAIRPETSPPTQSPFVNFNNFSFFTASDNQYNYSLYRTDGTATGTIKLLTVNFVAAYQSFNNLLYMVITDNSGKLALWRTDGTVAGTVLFKDLGSLVIPTTRTLTVWNNRLYFSGYDANAGWELWSTDGTLNGTRQVADVNVGPNSSFPYGFATFKNDLIFIADNGETGFELMKLMTTGIIEPMRSNTALTLFPNPSVSDIEIRFDDDLERVKIYNLNGQLVKNQVVSGHSATIPIQELENGTYIVVAVGKSKIATQKFIKNK